MAARKKTYYVAFLLLNVIMFSSFLNVKAQDQEATYVVGFDVGTELIWQISNLDEGNFKIIFGPNIDPNFEVGDQIRIVITGIKEFTATFIISYDFWDYKTDWGLPGQAREFIVYRDPVSYNYTTFALTPIDDYLAAAAATLPSEYTVLGNTVIKQAISNQNKAYRIEKEYDIRGLVSVETWYDEFNNIILRSEGTFRISFGMYFIGFTIVAMLGLIAVLITKKRLIIRH
ncbi:MAG: hypothetical protein ACFE9R_06665 [Candidatus Hermodarchaeota archaeon]